MNWVNELSNELNISSIVFTVIFIASFKLSTIKSVPSRYSAKDLRFFPVFTISDALNILILRFGMLDKLVFIVEDSFKGIMVNAKRAGIPIFVLP